MIDFDVTWQHLILGILPGLILIATMFYDRSLNKRIKQMQDSRVEFIQNTLEDSFKAEASIIEEEEQKEIISDIDELKTSLDNVKVVISSFNVDPVERGKVIEQFVMNNTEGSKTKKYEDLFALAGKLNSLKQGRNLNYANTEMVEQLKK